MNSRPAARSGWLPALAAAACAMVLSACSTPPLPESSEPVVGLMGERLALAREIAWAKWADGLPVRDPAREAALTAKLVRQGLAADMDERLITSFVRSQIDASCLEQEAWMRRWRRGTPLPAGEPPTLDSLRVKLDRMSTMLVAEFAAGWNAPPAAVRQRLLKTVIDPRAATTASSAFISE